MKLEKAFSIILLLLFTFLACFVYAAPSTTSNLRHKSKVMLIINNTAHSKHDKKLNEIMDNELHKKIDVLYREESAEKFLTNFSGKDTSKLTLDEFLENVNGCQSDYVVYTELKKLDKSTNYNFIYHGKKVTATFYVRIVDVKNKKELYSTEFHLTAEDSTDYYFVGSGSVSKKALKSVLFRAGEAISTYLPL